MNKTSTKSSLKKASSKASEMGKSAKHAVSSDVSHSQHKLSEKK